MNSNNLPLSFQSKFKVFPQLIVGLVTKAIALHEPGRVKINGASWRAALYELNCQTRLLSGQPVLAIGRRNNMLIVIPHHCLLWTQYLEEYGQLVRAEDIERMSYCENNWRP